MNANIQTPSLCNAIHVEKRSMRNVIFWDTLEITAERKWPVTHASELLYTKQD